MDDIERQLRDFGEQASAKIVHGPVPAKRIAGRARIRKAIMGFGSLSLIALASLGGYVGIRSLSGIAPNKASDPLLAVAAERTEEEGTARMDIDMSMKSKGPYGPRNVTVHGSGAIDFENDLFNMRVESDTGLFGARTEEVIHVDGVTYTRYLPAGDGDLWSRSSSSFLPGPSGSSFSSQDFNPTHFLEEITSRSDTVEVVGQEELDGETVTHYRATVDPDLTIEEVATAGTREVEEVLEGAQLGFDPLEIWVDSLGRVRRVTSGGEFGGGSSGFEFDMKFSMHYYDFGVPVHIDIPSPDQITDKPLPPPSNPDVEFEDPVLVTGKDGFEGPLITVARSDFYSSACIAQAPEWAEKAAIVEESSQEVVAEADFETMTLASPTDTESTPRSACLHASDRELGALIENPSRYVLHLIGGSRVVSIELIHAQQFTAPTS